MYGPAPTNPSTSQAPKPVLEGLSEINLSSRGIRIDQSTGRVNVRDLQVPPGLDLNRLYEGSDIQSITARRLKDERQVAVGIEVQVRLTSRTDGSITELTFSGPYDHANPRATLGRMSVTARSGIGTLPTATSDPVADFTTQGVGARITEDGNTFTSPTGRVWRNAGGEIYSNEHGAAGNVWRRANETEPSRYFIRQGDGTMQDVTRHEPQPGYVIHLGADGQGYNAAGQPLTALPGGVFQVAKPDLVRVAPGQLRQGEFLYVQPTADGSVRVVDPRQLAAAVLEPGGIHADHGAPLSTAIGENRAALAGLQPGQSRTIAVGSDNMEFRRGADQGIYFRAEGSMGTWSRLDRPPTETFVPTEGNRFTRPLVLPPRPTGM